MEEVLWSTLPSCLVEKIFCHIPFPQVLRVRELNSEWYSQFPRLNDVHQIHARWPIYCPAFLCPGAIFGFNRSNNRWSTLTFDILQQLAAESLEYERHSMFQGGDTTLEGPLLCIHEGPLSCRMCEVLTETRIRMVNLLSGRCRIVACPKPTCTPSSSLCGWLLQPPALRLHQDGSFQVLLLVRHGGNCSVRYGVECQVYKSKSNSWICRTFPADLPGRELNRGPSLTFTSTSLDGDVYTLEGLFDTDMYMKYSLLRVSVVGTLISSSEDFDLQSQSSNVLVEIKPEGGGGRCMGADIAVVRCGVRIILTVKVNDLYDSEKRMGTLSKLYEVQKTNSSFTAVELSTSPILRCGCSSSELEVQADDDCIYLCGPNLISYHLELNAWVDHGIIPDAACFPIPLSYERRILKRCFRFESGKTFHFQ